MHRDIRALLSHYLRNFRELSALFGDDHTIRCGYKCNVNLYNGSSNEIYDIIFDNKCYKYYSKYFDSSFRNKIVKNIYYSDNYYKYRDSILYNNTCIIINGKYQFQAYSEELCYYTHTINEYYVLVIDFGSKSYSVSDHSNKFPIINWDIISDISAIKSLFDQSMVRYRSRFN